MNSGDAKSVRQRNENDSVLYDARGGRFGVKQLLVLVALAAAACGPMQTGDAGGDVVASDAVDTASDGGTSTATFEIHVVEGPSPARPSASVHVAVRDEHGVVVEAVTDATGVARVEIDATAARLDVTVAKSGFGAVSVMGASRTLTGPIRIDPLGAATPLAFAPLSGTIANRLAAGSNVLVDGVSFETVNTTADTFATRVASWPATVPIRLVALEFDAAHANIVNAAASAEVPRSTMSPVVPIAFPSTPRPATHGTTTLAFPTTGVVTAAVTVQYPPNVQRANDGGFDDEANTTVGIASLRSPSNNEVVIDTQFLDGDLAPNLGYVQFENIAMTAFVSPVLHTFGVSERIEIGTVTRLDASGTHLGDLALDADTTGYEAHGLSVISTAVPAPAAPNWRCYTFDGSPVHALHLPPLPSGITLADIGISGNVAALPLAVRTRASDLAPWSMRQANRPVYDESLEIGGLAITIRGDGL